MNQVYCTDIPWLFTAIAEWGACLTVICRRPLRFTGPKLWGLLTLGLAVQCLFLHLTDLPYVALWLPCTIGATVLMLALIAACCNIPLISAGYCTAHAFLVAEFAASLEWQLYSYAWHVMDLKTGSLKARLLAVLFLVVVYGAVFWGIGRLVKCQEYPLASFIPHSGELWYSVIISMTCFLMSNLSFVYSNTPFSSSDIDGIYNIRTLVDLAGIVILYAYHIQHREILAYRELDSIQRILQNQYAQYKQFRESIDVVNRKYHDMKHQIAVLRAEQDPKRRLDFLDGMEEEIRTYEAQNKTGNSVLDTVLTSKSLYCAHHNIELTCVADGAQLDFINVMDICSIFGNILDNAIECELNIQDKKKRLIHLAVYARKNFLIIQCQNYCEGTLKYQDGLPLSTKGDSDYHGFGLKSIRYTVNKYGGSMTIHNLENWFELNIVIPVPVV